MNWRERWNRLSARERRLIMAAGAVLVLFLLRALVVSPFLGYRESLREEIATHREMLENSAAYLARAGDVAHQRDLLQTRAHEIRAQLVPGETPTLAAANLQETLHTLASEKGVNVQSTQVMREETIGDFHRIAVRVTVTGEIRQLADFLAGVEFGPRKVSIPFLEISRRGAVLRGQSGRALAATIEVNAFLQQAEAQPQQLDAQAAEPAAAPAVPGETSPAAAAASPAAPQAAATPQAESAV